MTVPALDLAELAPGTMAPVSTVPTVEYQPAPTVEPTLEVAGESFTLVWALTPNDPSSSAGLWPGTPWPGGPGRSLIGVLADLSTVKPGDPLTVDGRVWTVFEVRQVAPEDWESLAEQPVSGAEVAVYELGDSPVRAAALAREGGAR